MNQDGWNCFLELCLSTQDKKLLSSIFTLILTAEERESVATRCLIVKELLAEKKSQRQISKDLHVCIAKITRGSNELKTISSKLTLFLKEHLSLRGRT